VTQTRDLKPALGKIVRNAGSILLGDAGGEILTAYAIALAALKLGKAGFGTLSEAQAFMEPFEALAGFGLRQVAITIAARENGTDGRLRGTILGLQMVITLVSLVIALAFAVITGRGSLLGILAVFSVGMMVTPITTAAQLPFQFDQAMHRLVAVPFLASCVRVAASYLALWFYNAPTGYQLAILASTIATSALNWQFMKRWYPSKLSWDRDLAKRLLALAWPAAVLEFIVMAYVRGSYFLLHEAGPVVQGEYAAADRLIRPVLGLAAALFVSSLPTVAVLAAEHDYATLRRIYGKATLRIVLITTPVIIAAMFLSRILLRRFVPEYASSVVPFCILAVGLIFMFVNQLSTTFVVALGKFRVIMLVALTNLVVYVFLATRLIPHYKATGAALATSLMEAVNTCMQIVIVFSLLKAAQRRHRPENAT
jgi:O-antigen/teichoic acid export membrane protein